MRKKIIAGNWKMNKNLGETLEFLEELKKHYLDKSVEAVICAPFLVLHELKKKGEGIVKSGAENMHYEENGAYTGEISATMLKEAGMDYVILGHSERREYFGETDEIVNKKTKKALDTGLIPIVCIGETLEEREGAKMKEVVSSQVEKSLSSLSKEEMGRTVVAYEPVWAIGTGKTASSEQANEMIAFIRQELNKHFGEVSKEVSILYGGSVKPENIKELMAQSDIDGALVGGAALKADSFVQLINYKE